MLASLSGAVISGGAGRIVLRAPAEGDFTAFAEIRRDVDMQAMLLAIVDRSDDSAVADWIARRSGDANGRFRIVADADSDVALGYVQITDIHHRNLYGAVGIAIRRGAQGRGVGTAAIRLLHTFAKSEVGLEKLVLMVRADNAPAIAVYRRAGYRIVGTLERHFRGRDGVRHDVLLLECHLTGGVT